MTSGRRLAEILAVDDVVERAVLERGVKGGTADTSVTTSIGLPSVAAAIASGSGPAPRVMTASAPNAATADSLPAPTIAKGIASRRPDKLYEC